MPPHFFQRTLVAAGLSALAVAGAAAPARATSAGDNGRFAYGVLTGGIATIGYDGTHARTIVKRATEPAFSPDGRSLVYVGSSGALATARADGTHKREILKPSDRQLLGDRAYTLASPNWSSDGKRVVFAVHFEVPVPGSDDDEVRSASAVWTIRADGTGARRLRAGDEPAWSARSRLIAYTHDDAIWTVLPDGSGRRQILPASENYRHALDFSPDGRRLSFLATGHDGRDDIGVVDLRTGRVRTIDTPRGHDAEDAVWAPDGRRIAYLATELVAEGRTPPTSVHTVRSDGSGDREEFTLPFDSKRGTWAQSLSWQPLRR